jgi:hypothetical protein
MMDYIGATHLLHLFLSLSDQLPDQNAWGSSSSDGVPIPGRPIRPLDLTPDFCDSLVLKACLALHDDQCFDLKKDPLQGERKFLSLVKQLDKARASNDESLAQLMTRLTHDDCAPLSIFEPEAPKEVEGIPLSSQRPSQSHQLSQSHLSYMRRFKREYVLLYILRFGVDCEGEEKFVFSFNMA